MIYKRVEGRVVEKNYFEIKRCVDAIATEELPEYIQKRGGIICRGKPPAGYRSFSTIKGKEVYFPSNISFDGSISMNSSYSDKEFNLSVDATSKETRGSKAHFPNLGEMVVVYVCDKEVSPIVDEILKRLSLEKS